MNTILLKCVEELKNKEPNISYVLGMLETVIEMSGMPLPNSTTSLKFKPLPTEKIDEISIEDAYLNGKIGNIV